MCGIAGVVGLEDSNVDIGVILNMLYRMRERGTEHGSGFAAYSPSEAVRFRFFSSSPLEAKRVYAKLSGLRLSSLRLFASLGRGVHVYETMLSDYPPVTVLSETRFLQASRYLEVWKSAGWPWDVAKVYSVAGSYRALLGHTRYPTNSPGFQPWLAHPFTYGETAIVHNGDLSSYGANMRYVKYRLGLEGFTGNDSEVIAYLVDLLYRDGYNAEDIVDILVYGKGPRWARLDGPFAVLYIHGTSRGPIFGAFVDRHHFRPIYVAIDNNAVYAASEAAAIKAVNSKLKPRMLRGGGYVIVYPDGEVVARGLSSYTSFSLHPPPPEAIDASKMSRNELNQALARLLRRRGYAAAYNVNGHRYVANGLGPGKLELWGVIGNASLNLVEGIEARIYGDAQEDLADSATDSTIVVYGNVGDSAGQAMRSGELHVLGDAGNRLGVQLKGGTIVVRGDAGDYVGEFMAGGVIVVLGRVGRYVGSGMVGGKIYIAHRVPASSIGKAPPLSQLNRYVLSLCKLREIPCEDAEKALKADTVDELASILGQAFRRLSKLWGVLHVGYPKAEYRYLKDYEAEELKQVLERHIKITRVKLDVEDILNRKYTIVTSAKMKGA